MSRPTVISPAAIAHNLERQSERHTTPCGAGRLIWRRWRASTPANRPLVLVHGGSGSWTHWFKVIPLLRDTRDVWCVDLPGLGDSAMPPEPLTPATSGAILADGVRELFGANTIDLCAFSFGAHVSTYAAANLKQSLASFTLSGAAAMGLPHPELDFPKERAGMSDDEKNEQHRKLLEILMFKDPARIDALAIYLQSENIARARFRSRTFAASSDIAKLLPDVTAPLGAIWGDSDPLALPDLPTRYAVLREHHPELIAHTIKDAGHWVAYEQPELFAIALEHILEARAA
ncbi:MAG: alpha/beta hydrolase [Hyphomicrobiaceae bacterium]|nr:alpha/beta hydrolase [Hyphomicrobiaceae bacterium]